MDEIETLYRQHASAVFRFAWGLCGDRASAEDIVSETFLTALGLPEAVAALAVALSQLYLWLGATGRRRLACRVERPPAGSRLVEGAGR